MTTEPRTVADEFEPSGPYIRCGCGFVAAGNDEFYNNSAFDSHNCPNAPASAPRPWYGYVFSMWGALIAGIVAYALIVILTDGKVT